MTILLLSCIGVIVIYSANHGRPEPFFQNLYIKQMYWIIYGLLVMIITVSVDYTIFSRYAYVIYGLTVLALIAVLFFGVVSSGARRWLQVGPVNIQVSEFAKFTLIIILAKYFETVKPKGKYQIRDLIIPSLFMGLIAYLVSIQPDLGTAMMILFVFLVVIFSAEIDTKTLIGLSVTGVLMAPTLWFFMKDYQKTRLLTLFNPELDPLGAGYHTIQSKITIGSGGFWGKGLLAGTQSRLNFLPEKHTDFIFSVFAEEMGFIGVIVLFSIYLIIILKGLNIAYRSPDRFGMFLGIGVTSSLSFYAIYNIGMTLGIFPITGIPLPFMSYGGSSLITNFFAVGLLLNLDMRRTLR